MAVYDGLSESCCEHIGTCYDQDYQEMNEANFFNCLRSYEAIDHSTRKNDKVKRYVRVTMMVKIRSAPLGKPMETLPRSRRGSVHTARRTILECTKLITRRIK